MRVFSASLATETNTFASLPTGMQAFQDTCFFPPGEHPDALTFFAGPLWAARRRAKQDGWTLIEGLVAAAMPAGITTRETYETLRDQILEQLTQAMPVDVVALGLHGAMVADGYDDCEGDLLVRVRRIVGPNVAVGATLDPHGHISEQMIAASNLLISWKEYPHTDIKERGVELIDLLEAQARRRISLRSAMVDCEMISTIFTTQEPGLSIVTRMKDLEQRPGILSVSLNHGFPYGDVPDMGTKVMVYADGDAALALDAARELADAIIGMRGVLSVDYLDIDTALDQALAFEAQPVVIADGADNAGGGAMSDSTFFLRRMIERGITSAALGPLWDPCVVDTAFSAGIGARLRVRLGGKSGPLSGDPLDVEVIVKGLCRNHAMSGLSVGEHFNFGDATLLDVAGIDVAVVSKRGQAVAMDMFTGLGGNLRDKRIIVVKSSQHFYADYSKIAGKVLYSKSPGTVTLDLDTLDFRKIRKPKWPLTSQAPKVTASVAELPVQAAAASWIEGQIKLIAERGGAVIGVCARDVDGTRCIEYQAECRFPMASTYKVAIAGAVLSAVDRGEIVLSEMIDVPRRKQVIEGVVSMMFVHEGMALSLINLLEVMMADSDNSATDLLLERIGGPTKVMQWLEALNIEGIRIDRTTDRILRDSYGLDEDSTNLDVAMRKLAAPGFDPASIVTYRTAIEADERDTATPRAMTALLVKLASGDLLSVSSTQLLEGMMLRCHTQRHAEMQRLKARLPAGTPVAHKSGTLAGVANDVGWITMPDGRRVAITVFTRYGISPLARREQILEEVGHLIYRCFK